MDEPSVEILIKVVRVGQWQKTKAALNVLVATMPTGSIQKKDLQDVINQFVEYVEDNQLHK